MRKIILYSSLLAVTAVVSLTIFSQKKRPAPPAVLHAIIPATPVAPLPPHLPPPLPPKKLLKAPVPPIPPPPPPARPVADSEKELKK